MKKIYPGNYNIKLNEIENEKLKKVKEHYKETGIKKIFMGMVNAMLNKIPINTVEENQGDGENKSGIMRNFPDDKRNIIPEEE